MGIKKQFVLIFVIFGGFCATATKRVETPGQKLDDVITEAFRARDLNHDSILTKAEIRKYYETHPGKMTTKGIDFIDRNFSHGKNTTIDEYRNSIKMWLAENGTAAMLAEFSSNATMAHTSTTIIP